MPVFAMKSGVSRVGGSEYERTGMCLHVPRSVRATTHARLSGERVACCTRGPPKAERRQGRNDDSPLIALPDSSSFSYHSAELVLSERDIA